MGGLEPRAEAITDGDDPMAEDGGTKLASVTVTKTAEAASSVPHALRSREEAEESEEDRVCLGRVLYVTCCMWHVVCGMWHVA